MELSVRVIGTKRDNPSNERLGYLGGILIEKDGVWEVVTGQNLPNSGELFIPRNYSALNSFDQKEILVVDQVEEIEYATGDCRYRADGANFSRLDYTTEDIHSIIEVDRTITNSEVVLVETRIKPTQLCFLSTFHNNEEVLAGPYAISSSRILDDQSFQCELRLVGDNHRLFPKLDAYSVYRLPLSALPNGTIISTSVKSHDLALGLRAFIGTADAEQINIISDESLIRLIDDAIPNSSSKLGRKGKRELVKQIEAAKKLNKFNKDKLIALLEMDDEATENLKSIFELKFGKVSKNTVGNSSEVTELEAERDRAKQQVEEKNSQITAKNEELEALREQLEVNEAKLQELDSGEVEVLNERIAELMKVNDAVRDVEELDSEITKLSVRKELLIEEEEGLKDTVASLKRDLASSTRQFREQALQVLPFFEIMQNVKSDDTRYVNDIKCPEDHVSYQSLEEAINEITNRIDTLGYVASRERIVAIISVYLSNKFIGFYGDAGVGKTTLANALAQAVSGTNQYYNAMVRVAKGWTSHTDFVGYYNSFSNKFEFQRPFFEKFESGQNTSCSSIYNVILDESNLSSPELYLSDFLAETEGTLTNKESIITLSGSDFKIPQDMRMILTFNVDETTELLSPRMLDRMPIATIRDVELEASDLTQKAEEFDPLDKLKLAEQIQKYRDPKVEDVISEVETKIDIWKILPDFHVSFRKRQQIESFCKIAVASGSLSTAYIAECVEEIFLLPLIRGYGHNYGEQLDKLVLKIESSFVKNRLYAIIRQGEAFGSYRHV